MAVPQLHGQYEGDRSRKETLVEHGFRLPSAADNRPLRFEEVMERVDQVVFLSATPGTYELDVSDQVVEQIIRPTGLVDPEVVVKPTKGQIDDLLERDPRAHRARTSGCWSPRSPRRWPRTSPTTCSSSGVRVRYLHSEVDTIERIEILRDLRLGEFDVLVGINLLREGLDLPEVSLVAILDADKEGFLRSETSLIQTIGRAARNVERPGDHVRRPDDRLDAAGHPRDQPPSRSCSMAYNDEHGIDPQTIRKAVTDILAMIRPRPNRRHRCPERGTPLAHATTAASARRGPRRTARRRARAAHPHPRSRR